MILLITERLDPSTYIVTKWLDYYGKKWTRISEKNFFEQQNYSISLTEKGMSHSNIGLTEYETIWFRRIPQTTVENFQKETKLTTNKLELIYKIHQGISSDYNTIYNFIENKLFQSNKTIGLPGVGDLNKLHMLRDAQNAGFKIPDTYLTNNKTELKQILAAHPKDEFIIKPVFNINSYVLDGTFFTPYTRKVSMENFDDFDEQFHSTLIQKKIQVAYEVRIFYFEGKFFAMAIFSSQKKDNTIVDFRAGSNRRVPFKVPQEIQNKLKQLFHQYQFNYCSVDLLCSADGTFYFLEINPVGQFGFVSYPCNYFIEREIARAL